LFRIKQVGSNISIGINFAGIHYRTDAKRGIMLGETIAVNYMEDMLSTMVENNLDGTSPSITFRKYDGIVSTIKPRMCMWLIKT